MAYTEQDKAAYYAWSRHWWATYRTARYTPGWRWAFRQWVPSEQMDAAASGDE